MGQLPNSSLGQLEERLKLGFTECRFLTRPLYFDESSLAGHDHIHVHVRCEIHFVIEIEYGSPVDQAHTDGSQAVTQGVAVGLGQ